MNETLKQLKKVGVHYIKSDFGIMLEIIEDKLTCVEKIDALINELITKLPSSNFKKIRLECPRSLLNELNDSKDKMKTVGERVIYTKSFKESIEILDLNYEVWPTFNRKSISFLSEIMGGNVEDTEKFLISMKSELPSQVEKMYTVYMVCNEPVGVVFPHIEPDTNKEGRMFWIGVHPKFLGKGLGKNLHLIGLYRLQKEFEAKSYLGATQVDNAPMRQIMNANGCVQNKSTVISLEFSF